MRHDGDEFFNKSTAEMRNLFDETFDVSNEELVSIEEEFSLFLEGLKVDISLANLTVSLVSVSDFISNYTDHIQPAKQNASYNVGNIMNTTNHVLNKIRQYLFM